MVLGYRGPVAGEGDLEHWREARLAGGLQKTLGGGDGGSAFASETHTVMKLLRTSP